MRWHAVLAVLVVAASLVGGDGRRPPRPVRPGFRASRRSRRPPPPARRRARPPPPHPPRRRPRGHPDRRPTPCTSMTATGHATAAATSVGTSCSRSAGRCRGPAAGCRADWTTTRRDAALNWKKASYVCLDQLTGRGFKPQGVGGSGSTAGYRIGGRAAAHRNIVLVSSYSTVDEKGLRFAHRPGKTEATRLTVIDLDRGRFNQVELVRPVGVRRASPRWTPTAAASSGSGQYLYASSRGSLWMFNADDLMEIDGRHVLPAVAGWRVRGRRSPLQHRGRPLDRQDQTHRDQLHRERDRVGAELRPEPGRTPGDGLEPGEAAAQPAPSPSDRCRRRSAAPGRRLSRAPTSKASAPRVRTGSSTRRR